LLWLFSDIVQDNIDDKHVKYYYYGSTEPDNPENLDPDSWIETTYYGPISITITNDVTNSQITFTNGASYTPVSPTAGTTNQPIGGFSLQADIPGASLTSVTINVTGTRSGITNLKLWNSTDATFNASSDTLLNSQSDNASVTFSGFSSTISTAGSYYFVTADLSTSASGSIALTIGSVSNLTFNRGAIASGFTNAPLSSGTITIILIREMNITGNGETILNGDTSPAASDHTDFGSADIASGSVVHTFTIQNNGAEALSLTGSSPFVAISGATADFSLTQNPSSSIAANSSTTFEITFNPASTGLKSAVISIANDDGDENPYTFTIQGTGTAVPNMSVSGNSVQITDGDASPSESDYTDFGSVNIAGDPIEHTFTIANNGSASLTLTGSSPYVSLTGDTEDFTLTQLPASNIAAGGGTTTFKITFKPTATGNRSATVSIANDDDSKNPFNFSIRGSGISVPTVTTAAASSVTKTVATLGGNVTSDGASPITETGVVYSSSNATPTIGGMDVIQNANIDLSVDFSESISPLSSATHYYFQAYATNAAGTSYGGVLEFTTLTSVVSILRAEPDDTNAASVRWNVVFENNVTGLSASNFTLVSFGISGAAITAVSGSGTNWIVTASTGSGTGSLRLGLVNDNGLTPKLSNPTLGGDAYTLDLVSPSVTDVDTGKPDGTYGVGSSIGIVIMFDESHNVDGTPQLTLKMDSMNRVIDCISNEHIRLICTYTVQAGDNTSDLDYAGMTALSTNGGTIRDYHGNDAILNLPWNAGAGSLAGNNAIVIDTTPPEITIHHPGTTAAVSKTITASTPDGTLKMSKTRGTTCDGSLSFAAYASQTFTAETDNGIQVCYQAVDAVNNISYKLSDPITGIDTTAPTTSITAKPDDPDNSASPSFTFSGEDPDGSGVAGFECSLDGAAFSSCSSPKSYSSLIDGNHTFQVRSVDAAGNADASPESYTWQIDTSLPETTISSSPANLTTSTDAVFEFEGADPGGSGIENLECMLDSSTFSVCTSPKEYNALPDGSHNFQVRAVDTAGNVDPSPAEINWTIDTTAPTVLISSTESDPTNVNPIPITVQFSEPVTGFEESDIIPGNSTISGFLAVDSSTYSFNLIPSSEGTVTLDIPAAVTVDAIGFSNLAAEQFSIVFGMDLVITSPDHAAFIVGIPNTFNITTSGFPFPTISTADTLPAGITLIDHHDGTATLEGTPEMTTLGTYTFDISAVNVLSSAVQNFSLSIEESAGISKVESIADTGDSELSENEHTNVLITLLLPVFSKDMQHISALDPFDVLNPSLYHLKINDLADISIDHVTYDNHSDLGPFVATLSVNGGIPLIQGKYKLTIDGSMKDRSGFPIGSNFERVFYIDHQDPKTVIITIGNGNSLFTNGSTIDTSLSGIKVTFDEDVSNSGNGTDPDDVTNPFNYLLLQTGPDNIYNTNSCLAFANNGNSPVGDDIHIPTGTVTYDNHGGDGPFVATIALNEGKSLPNGYYRLFICGSTSIVDLAKNPINNGKDASINFRVLVNQSVESNPLTGFRPGALTILPQQTDDKAYHPSGNLWLQIPSLNLEADITGVPQAADGWDVTWLQDQIGWLEGTAYPTWNGNTVLTAHAYKADGLPGPFASLKNLKYGDILIIHLDGQSYTYIVDSSVLVDPDDTRLLTRHEDRDWLTLITCQQFNEASQSYRYRRVVRAVRSDVQ
jgi:LPXTG-site transpeptidase (sortase) family protein